MQDLLQEIFNENEQKYTDLFGAEIWFGKLQDGSRNTTRVYVDYFKFVSEVLKVYRPEVEEHNGVKYISPCKPSQLTKEDQQDIKEMIEAVLDTIHYAKFKGVKRNEQSCFNGKVNR